MAISGYCYNENHGDARYVAEMIALAPAKVSDLYSIRPFGGSVGAAGFYASFTHPLSATSVVPFTDEAAIAQVKASLADALAAYAATRTATHVPKWTFMYNNVCTEDLETVAAIRASPPPVAIQFAVNTNLPPGESCILFPSGDCWKQARARVLSELRAATEMCFRQRPSSTSTYVLVVASAAIKVRQAVASMHEIGRDVHVQVWPGRETVTTLWAGNLVFYGDKAVIAQLNGRVWEGYKETCATVAIGTTAATAAIGVTVAIGTTAANIPLAYFLAARDASMTPPPGYAPDSVRYRMSVRDKERDAFLSQLFALPAEWRSRISVVFVTNEAAVDQNCVDLWPQAAAASSSYEGVLAILGWTAI